MAKYRPCASPAPLPNLGLNPSPAPVDRPIHARVAPLFGFGGVTTRGQDCRGFSRIAHFVPNPKIDSTADHASISIVSQLVPPMPIPSAPELRHQDPAFVRGVFDRIARRYDLTNTVLCAGCDSLWRRRLATLVQSWQPLDILDLATGSGVLAEAIQRRNPTSIITGVDFSEPMLRQAKAQRGQHRLMVADALHLPLRDASFDAVTVAFGLRNMASWSLALAEMRRVLRPGGHVAVLDFSLPRGWLREPYRIYLHRVLPRLAGIVSREREGYEYLAESIESFPSGPAMTQLLAEAGFAHPVARPMTAGIVSLYSAGKPETRAGSGRVTPSN